MPSFIESAKEKIRKGTENLFNRTRYLKYLPREFTKTAKDFPEEFVKTTSKIAENLPIPGKQIAKGAATTLAKPYVEKLQRDLTQTTNQFQDAIRKEYHQATLEKDTQKQQRLEKIIKQFKYTNLLEDLVSEAPTTRQILADAGELALLATLGYKPYLSTGKLTYGKEASQLGKIYQTTKQIKQAEKLATASKAVKFGTKFVKPVVTQAGIGAAFYGATKATEKDATINDIIKSAEQGALISGGITAGSIALGEGIKLASEKVVPAISQKWQKTMIGLEKAAAGEGKKPAIQSQVDKTLSYIGEKETFKQKSAQTILKMVDEVRKMETRLIDRFAPGKRIEARISQMKGRPLSESEKIYRDMRLLTATSDASAEQKIIGLIDDINNYDDQTRRKALSWLTQLDFIDRARLGQAVPGNQSLDDLITGLNNLAKEIGPDDMKKVAAIRNSVYNYNAKLLQERVDAGLISKELKNILLKTHPNYIPHDVILAVDERVAQGLSSSLNVPKTDIMKAIGSAKNIKDPLEATIARTRIATRVIEKNKILNNFVKAQEQYNLFPGMKQIKAGVKPQVGFDTINLFRNGIKETWQVSEDIAIAIKNLDAPITPGWFEILTTPQKILKKGATQYNLSFSLPNKFRDKQTAALTAQAFIESMAQKTGVKPQAVNLSSKELKDLYKISGGYGSSIFKEGESKILADLQKTGITKVLGANNPAKIIDTINNNIEVSTRLEVFKSALQRGLSPKDAALVARDATIDFAKMGSWMRPVNKVIPFLNARIQGFLNLPKAFVSNPEVFTRMQMYTAVYPTLALHQHNRRFDSYANISQYMKDKYWIIMTGETDGIDSYTGNPIKVPQFITVPKGEGQTLVSGPIQYYLEKADGIDFRKTSEMLADTLGSASPLEFQTWGGGNIWLTLAGQLGPMVSIPAGLAANKVPYSGAAIVPESRKQAEPYMQFTKYTPEITKEVGKILNVSPAQIDFILSSFGGLPQDMQRAVDIVYGVVRDGNIGGNSISETPWGSLTQVPLVRRFIRESGEQSSEEEFRYQQKEEIQRELETKKLQMYDKAEEIWQEMNKKKTKEDKLNYLNSLGDEVTPEIRERLMYLKTHRQTVEVLKTTDSVELRARYILQRLDEMKKYNIPKSERLEFLNDLEEKKILTDSVKRKIYQIQNEK